MPLYIRDDEVGSMAQRLAAEHKTTVTEAVRRALLQALADLEDASAARDHAIRKLFDRFDQTPTVQPFGDAEMYDEQGLPR